MNLKKVAEYINGIFYFALIGLLFVLPLFFWNLTSEFYEMPKFILLSAGVLILLAVWVIKFVILGKVTLTKSFLDLPFLLLLIIFLVSTFLLPPDRLLYLGHCPEFMAV